MSYTPEKNRQYLNERYATQRQIILKYLGGQCAVCGVDSGLEVDHKEWREKSFRVGRLWPVKKLPELFKELDKCQLLCAQHHRDKTKIDLSEIMTERSSGATHGGVYAWMKLKCNCDPCAIARNEFNISRREARRTAGGAKRGTYGRPAEHGEILMYRRGCKCDLCRKANTEYAKTLKNKATD